MNERGLLINAILDNKFDVFLKHLEAGCDPHGDPFDDEFSHDEPMIFAMTMIGNAGIPYIKALLEYGANPNKAHYTKTTFFEHSVAYHHPHIAWLLLEYDADTTVKHYSIFNSWAKDMIAAHDYYIQKIVCILSIRSKSDRISRDVIGLVAQHVYSFRKRVPDVFEQALKERTKELFAMVEQQKEK